jgi:hypothetical protein
MDVKRNGSQPSGKGPAEYFTGTVLQFTALMLMGLISLCQLSLVSRKS